MPATLTTERELTTKDDEARRVKRLALALPLRIEGKDNPTEKWDEVTRLKDISPFGAGFTLQRPLQAGCLVLLTLPMPRQMRCYDYLEPQYKVWGIIRRCKSLDDGNYFIGVGFIGKVPPRSYMANPSQIYEISHRAEEGLWQITASESNPDESNSPKDDRKHSRYGIPVNMIVELIDKDDKPLTSETTVSENISLGGASVFTSLNVDEGTYLKVTSSQYNVSMKAIVRGKRIGPDGIPRLHIEFIDDYFPLRGIEL